MRALKYFVDEAAASLWRSRRSALLAVLTIAAGLFVLGFFLMVNANVQRARRAVGARRRRSRSILRDDATPEQVEAVEALIDQSGLAAGRQYVRRTRR